MNANEIQKKIDKLDYWDARVSSVECNYFADEIRITYNDENGYLIYYTFSGCYKSIFDHVKHYDKSKPVKEMTLQQIPYFLTDVAVEEKEIEKEHFLICKINMFPLNIEIWCKNIDVGKVDKNSD